MSFTRRRWRCTRDRRCSESVGLFARCVPFPESLHLQAAEQSQDHQQLGGLTRPSLHEAEENRCAEDTLRLHHFTYVGLQS